MFFDDMNVEGWVGFFCGWLEVGIKLMLGQRSEGPLEQFRKLFDAVGVVGQPKVAEKPGNAFGYRI